MRRLAISFAAFTVTLLLAGCSGGGPVTMPDVVGKRLDVAISDVERAGFNDEVEILGGGIFGVVDESNWTVCSQEPRKGKKVSSAPRFTVDRTCDVDPNQESETSGPVADAYSYQGPQYEIVTVDEDFGNAKLDQYWVYTGKLDYSTDAYKDQVKMIIADIAHKEKTAKLIVQVVTDKEIIESETNAEFMDAHGTDYFRNVIVPKEKTDWVAWYAGGRDPDTALPSESAEAFEVGWFLAADAEFEKWKPEFAG